MRLEDILVILRTGRGVSYDGEAVDELTHAMQCAGQAMAAGASDELIVAAALHDVGRAPAVRSRFGELPHEHAGARYCWEPFGGRVAWLIASHVPAKRCLVAIDPDYRAGLSPASVRSLAAQGGPLAGDELEDFQSHLWYEDAISLRRWDDGAKDPLAVTPSLSDLTPYFERVGTFDLTEARLTPS